MKKAASFFLLLVTFILFQNCSKSRFNSNPETLPRESGGQSYDGKLYVVMGSCQDGTLVESRIHLVSNQKAMLLRENCADITPRDLPAGSFQFDPAQPEQVVYNNQTYVAERAPIPLPPLTKANYQWNGPFQSFAEPVIYFVDAEYQAAEIEGLKTQGHTVICLITAGVTYPSDPDSGSYMPADIGRPQVGRPNDYWLDTRSANVRSVMIRKLDRARAKGCSGVLWDQTDAYTNDSGFALDEPSAIDFAKFLALAAHDRRMLVSLANTGGISADVVDFFDMQYGQNCHQSNRCDSYRIFATKGKPVLLSEDGAFSAPLCTQNRDLGFTLWFTSPTQDGSRYEPCP